MCASSRCVAAAVTRTMQHPSTRIARCADRLDALVRRPWPAGAAPGAAMSWPFRCCRRWPCASCAAARRLGQRPAARGHHQRRSRAHHVRAAHRRLRGQAAGDRRSPRCSMRSRGWDSTRWPTSPLRWRCREKCWTSRVSSARRGGCGVIRWRARCGRASWRTCWPGRPALCYLCGLLHNIGKVVTLGAVHELAQRAGKKLDRPRIRSARSRPFIATSARASLPPGRCRRRC